MVTLSPDGYLRMTFADFANIPFVHLLSGLDDDDYVSHPSLAYICSISGYTEWISSISPVVTIGWDWRLEVSQGRPRYALAGSPRSNLMFLDEARRDMGPVRTIALLEAALDATWWQEGTIEAISARYSLTTWQVC